MLTCQALEGNGVDILTIQILNSLFYASVLFLIAAGLSLIFGVMRIVNMAHGTFYAVGAFVSAWLVGRAVALGLPAGWMFLLIPVGAGVVALLGAVIEPLLLRPFYRRAEEYQLLVTFGLLLILEDVIRLLWGGLPLSAEPVMDALPIVRIAGLIYPAYNLFVIGIGVVAALLLWVVIYRTKFGVMLRATSRIAAWPRRSGSMSGWSTCRHLRSAASWRASAARSSCRVRRRCSGWASTRSYSPSLSSSSAASAACKARSSA